jgi:tubulin-folding cofactor B
MSHLTTPDITILISVPSTTSASQPSLAAERRISPSWPITILKAKLETVTGIPPSAQLLRLLTNDGWLVLSDGSVSDYPLRNGSELEIGDSRPVGMRGDFTDVNKVEKFELPMQDYERLDDSVLAWKRRRGLGRFDPNAKSREEVERERRSRDETEVASRGIRVGGRCRVAGDDGRRGVVRFVGGIDGLGGEREAGCQWVGVELDEPVGRNDGSVLVKVVNPGEGQGEGDDDGEIETEDGKQDGKEDESGTGKKEGKEKEVIKRLFQCKPKFGVFARPEKVEMGEWPVLDDLEEDEDMEEI